jgi:hypothetical protein
MNNREAIMSVPQPDSRADGDKPTEGIVLTEAQKRSRRERSVATAWALGVLVILFFAVTMVRGAGLFVRPPM